MSDDSPTPFNLMLSDADIGPIFIDFCGGCVNVLSIIGVCGESKGFEPTNELSSQHLKNSLQFFWFTHNYEFF
jgi:hypothetical protein